MTSLTEYMHQIVNLTDHEIDIIESAFHTLYLPKGHIWIEQGRVCNHVAFLSSGRIRNYHIDEKGNEVTCALINEHNFVSAYASFLTNTPSKEHIMALDNSVLRTISKIDLEAVSMEIPKLQIVRRVIVENIYILMEQRISMLQSHTAGDRYQQLLEHNPDIILHVPLQHTASYLGITPQHLSRLRKDSSS